MSKKILMPDRMNARVMEALRNVKASEAECDRAGKIHKAAYEEWEAAQIELLEFMGIKDVE